MVPFSWLQVLLYISAAKYSFAWGPSDIQHVHVVASNHFDAGYTNYTKDVLNEYFDDYIPAIPHLAQQLGDSNITFTFMEHAWILSLYMDCPPNAGLHCPSEQQLSTFRDAVNKQQITWYAFPFNAQLELYSEAMVEFGVYLSMKHLPSLFDNAHIPTTLSQRDVPGLTRAAIPILKSSGVEAISIGANTRAAPADVPPVFRWLDMDSNQDIVVVYHAGGYGGVGVADCPIIDGFTHTLATYWNSDNAGPPTLDNILQTLHQLQLEFPNAQIGFDTLDGFIDALQADADIVASLPVVTQEIGDTWTYGIASDPLKLAKFRSVQRLLQQCLAQNQCQWQSPSFANFSRFLMKNGEHTFGGSYAFIGQNYSDEIWRNDQLEMALSSEPYQSKFDALKETWLEQRQYGIDYAMQALQTSTDYNERALFESITREFHELDQVQPPNLSEWTKIDVSGNDTARTFTVEINASEYDVRFDARSGCIQYLYNTRTGVNYVNQSGLSANDDHNLGLGLFMYQTYTSHNFSVFWNEYSLNPAGDDGCSLEYCRNGMSQQANFTNTQYNAYQRLIAMYRHSSDANVFMVEADLGADQVFLRQQFGAPAKLYITYNFSSYYVTPPNNESATEDMNAFGIQLLVIDKQRTRLPEVLWMAFRPNIEFEQVLVQKISSTRYINIDNVVQNGTFHLHAIAPNGRTKSIFNNGRNSIQVAPIDSALAAFVPKGYSTITDIVTPFVNSTLNQGVFFALFNNFWFTNYPQWYPFDERDSNQKYRFDIYLT